LTDVWHDPRRPVPGTDRCGERAEMKGKKIIVVSRYGPVRHSCIEQKQNHGKPA
jgi:hypothetical protein